MTVTGTKQKSWYRWNGTTFNILGTADTYDPGYTDPEDPTDPPVSDVRPPKGTAGTIQYEEVVVLLNNAGVANPTLQQVFDRAATVPASRNTKIILTFPPGEFTFRDFAQAMLRSNNRGWGIRLPNNVGIAGSGMTGTSATIFKMVENSSTAGPFVPQRAALKDESFTPPKTPVYTGTSQYSYMVLQSLTVDGTRYGVCSGLTYKNFALIGTHQEWGVSAGPLYEQKVPESGHLYNGLRLEDTVNAVLENVYIEGMPGDAGSPPGETFSINVYRGSGITLRNVEVSGIRLRQGKTVSICSSPFGYNSHDNGKVYDCYFHDCYCGMPTSWLSENGYWENVKSYRNKTGFNHERVLLATHVNPTIKLEKKNPHHITMMNDGLDGAPADGSGDQTDYRDGKLIIRHTLTPFWDQASGSSTNPGKLIVFFGKRGTGSTDAQTIIPDIKINGVAMSTDLYTVAN